MESEWRARYELEITHIRERDAIVTGRFDALLNGRETMFQLEGFEHRELCENGKETLEAGTWQ